VGVDNAWEQEKLEAGKMLENAAESNTSGARCVRRCLVYHIEILGSHLKMHKFM